MNDTHRDTAALYVLDQLDDAARASFEARMLVEPELAAHVRELESGLARAVRALPRREPPANLLGKIEKAIDGQGWSPTSGRAGQEPARSAGSTIHWATLAQWGIAAVIALSLATLAIQSVRHSAARPVFVVVGLDGNRNTFTELPQTGNMKDADTRFIQLASLADNYWRNPADLPVQPAATGDSRGYAVFDPASRQGFIAVEQIPVLTANQRYHLWVADASTGRVRDAGTLPLAGLNRGLYSFALDPADNPKIERPQLFITAEDATASARPDQPRGKVVLGQRSF
jgi:hypothetical protein